MEIPPPDLTPGGALSSRLIGELLGDDQPRLPPGTRLGPFQIRRELGQGGLGVVYLAERADGAFEQQVALKVIRPDTERGLAETLLARERRILAKLRHPGIGHIIDGGQAEGIVWFAMEYVDGERIDHYCRNHNLDGRTRLTLLRKVGEAVAYAHARLVLHRDIKPANILVDAGGEPRLLDFGIAAALDEADRDNPARRAATPGLASPEQYRGEAGGIATDVYQLGRLLALLMRDVPFADARGLAAVRERALADEPDNRYPNVEAFNADLRALLARRPVSTREHDRTYRCLLFLRRHRLGSLLTATATAAFLAIVGYLLWHLDAARQRAELEAAAAQREAATAQRVSEFMISVFEGASPYTHRGQKPTVDELLAHGRERIETELEDEPRIKGALLAALGRVYVALDEIDLARPMLEQAVALGEGGALPDQELAQRKVQLSYALTNQGDFNASQSQLGDALNLLVGRDQHTELQQSVLRELESIDCFEGQAEDSMERLAMALERARGTPAESSPAFAMNAHRLGLFLHGTGRNEEALVAFAQAHRVMQAFHGDQHPITLIYAMQLAHVLAETGDEGAAYALIEDVLERTVQIFGANSHRVSEALGMKGRVAFASGDVEAAVGHYESAIALGNSLPAHTDIDSISILESLGEAYMALGRWEEALDAFEEMLARVDQGRRTLRADVGQRPLMMARALSALGRCDEAAEYWRQASERATNVSSQFRIHMMLAEPLPGCHDAVAFSK